MVRKIERHENHITILRLPLSARSSRKGQNLKTIVKWVIAAIVIVGLVLATRQAADQWKSESATLKERIASVDRQIENESDLSRRQALQHSRDSLQRSIPSFDHLNWPRIGLAALIYAIALLPPAFLLRRAVISLGHRPSAGTALAAHLLGHTGKYVPGKAMVIILRAGALQTDGVPPMTSTIAVFIETFIVMAAGATVAGVVVLWLPVPTWIAATAFLGAAIASLPTFPPILRRAVTRLMKVDVEQVDSMPESMQNPGIGISLVAFGWALALISWSLFGASFALLVSAIPSMQPIPPPIQLYAISTAAISLAMVIGFASLLPGGAGIRELVLATVLGTSLGTAHGLLSAIALRVLSIVVESGLAAGSWFWLRYTGRKEQ